MLRSFLSCAFFISAFSVSAAEKVFDFGKFIVGNSPTGFVSVVTGKGNPGDWKIVESDVPTALAPLSPNATTANKRLVLAQTSQDETDEHFPILICTNEVFGDFTFTTRFKCVSGKVEQMAGVAFRIQDEKNYYVVRASSLGGNFRFYKFVEGVRSAPIGPAVEIPSGVWHEMSVSCKGNEIRCAINGKEMPAMQDNSFKSGKIGFWTKSDAVTHFADSRISYTPREPFAQQVIREMMTKYPRLIGLKLYANKNGQLQVVASSDEKDLGEKGTPTENDVIVNEKFYYSKGDNDVSVTLPLRDRNGEAVGALRVTLKSFPGQTESNALARTMPINQQISIRIQSVKDLVE